MRSRWLGAIIGPAAFAIACSQNAAAPRGDGGANDGGSRASITLQTTLGDGLGARRAGNAAFVAGRDGDGPWRVLTGTNGRYALELGATRLGISIVCEEPASGTLTAYTVLATTADLDSLFTHDCPSYVRLSAVDVQLNVRGLPSGEEAEARLGSYVGVTASAQTPIDLGAEVGRRDLIAYKGPRVAQRRILPNKMIQRRELDLRVDTNITVDFASEGFNLSLVTVPLPQSDPTIDDSIDYGVWWTSTRGTSIPLDAPGTTTWRIAAPPESASLNGELYAATVVGRSASAYVGDRRAKRWFQRVEHFEMALPPPFDSPALADSSADGMRVSVRFSPYPSAGWYQLETSSQTGSPTEYRSHAVSASAAWLGSATTLDTVDLTALTGWRAAWNHPAGTPVIWWAAALRTEDHDGGASTDYTASREGLVPQ